MAHETSVRTAGSLAFCLASSIFTRVSVWSPPVPPLTGYPPSVNAGGVHTENTGASHQTQPYPRKSCPD